jgi:hypothetical protein
MNSEVYVRLCVSGLTIITAIIGGVICIFLKFNTKLATQDELKSFKEIETA